MTLNPKMIFLRFSAAEKGMARKWVEKSKKLQTDTAIGFRAFNEH